MSKITTISRRRRADGKAVPQLAKPRRRSWTGKRREAFLSELAATANVSAAARAAGMSLQGAYQLRRRDPAFGRAWREALAEGYERLELMLLDRALNGTEKDVWYRGEKVGTMRDYSDGLALSLLRAHRDTVRPAAAEEEDVEAARAEILAKLSTMKRRMGGDG